jgi:putative FmdB family regulatory protein
MPLYEYKCTDCGFHLERYLSIDDRDLPTTQECPACGEYCVVRGVGCGSFILKGGCWASDGYSGLLGDNEKYKAGKWDPTKID